MSVVDLQKIIAIAIDREAELKLGRIYFDRQTTTYEVYKSSLAYAAWPMQLAYSLLVTLILSSTLTCSPYTR